MDHATALNETDFLKTDVIENIHGDSWFHRVDPRVKLVTFVLFTIVNAFFLDPLVLSLLFASTLPFWFTAKTRFRDLRAFLGGYLIFLAAVTVSQGLSNVGALFEDQELTAVFRLGPVVVTWEGLWVGFTRSLRMANPIMFALLVITTTDPVMFSRALVKFHVPFEIAFMFLSGLRFLPLAMEEARNVSDAQTVRGVRGRGLVGRYRRLRTAIFPLFLNSLRRARSMGLTIECKAFGAKRWNEFLREMKLSKKDLIPVVYITILVLAAAYLRFVVGWGWSQTVNPF